MYDNKEEKSVCDESLGHAQTGRNEQETETKGSCSEGVGDAQIEATSPVKAQHESALATLIDENRKVFPGIRIFPHFMQNHA